MIRTISRLGDRMLDAFAPKARASACYCAPDPHCYDTFGGITHQWCTYNCNCVETCGSPFLYGPCP